MTVEPTTADARLRAALRAHPFLEGLAPEQIDALLPRARLLDVPAGTLMAREGDPADCFHLLLEGRVAIEMQTPMGGPMRLQTVGPGETLGWSWLLSPQRRQFDLRAVEPARLVAVDAETARAACAADRELGFVVLQRLLAVVARRLTATRLQLLDVYR